MSGTEEQKGEFQRPPETLIPLSNTPPALFGQEDEIGSIAARLKLPMQTLSTLDWTPNYAGSYGNPNLPVGQLNAFAARRAYRYALSDQYDYELLAEFVQDFENYVQSDFAKIDTLVLREIKRQLRYGGIYTGKATQNVAEALALTARLEDILDWPDSRETKTAQLNPKCWAYLERRKREESKGTQIQQLHGTTEQIPTC